MYACSRAISLSFGMRLCMLCNVHNGTFKTKPVGRFFSFFIHGQNIASMMRL